MSVRKQPAALTIWKGLMGALIVVYSAGTACAQDDVTQFVNGGSQGQQFISANQLLTPRKAQQATDRAREDILHGHFDSAQKELIRALEVAPHYGVALAIQGAVNLQLGDIEAAAKVFHRALEEDPTLGAAYVGLAMVFIGQHKFKEALIPLNRATSLLPSSWYPHFEAGLAHLELGDTAAALQEADLAERFAGPEPERRSGASYLHALAYAVIKDSDRAKKYLAETISRDPRGLYATLAKRRSVERLQVTTIGKP